MRKLFPNWIESRTITYTSCGAVSMGKWNKKFWIKQVDKGQITTVKEFFYYKADVLFRVLAIVRARIIWAHGQSECLALTKG